MINNALEIWQQPRFQERIDAIKNTQDEARRLGLIKQLFREIQAASSSIVDKMDEGTVVNNLDEVTTSFHNELKQNTTRLLTALKDLKLSGEEQNKISMAVQKDALGSLQDEFQTIRIKKNRDRVEVTNLHELGYPAELRVNNMDDLKKFFDSLETKLAEGFKITIPAPQVHVEAPIVNVPPHTVNIAPTDFEPIVHEVREGLQKIRTNNKSNPVFVRLTDVEAIISKLEEVRKGQMTALSGFPNQMFLKDINSAIISPAQQSPDTLKAFANINAGTTDGAIITAVATRILRIVSVACVAAGTATNITFNSKSGSAGTAITCLFANGANGGEVLPYNPKGWFDTNQGEGLTATTGGGSATGVLVNYFLV